MSFAARPQFLPPAIGGGGGGSVVLSVPSDASDVLSPAVASASFTLGTTGVNWFVPTGGAPGTGYWARFTRMSGTSTLTGSSLNTWLPLTSPRGVTATRNTVGFAVNNFTVEIASDAGGSTIVATQTNVQLTVSVEI